MTSGIYCLKFNNTYKVYIGKSKHIEERFKEHLYSFKNNSAANKLQEAYNKYGIPTLVYLAEEDNENLLDILEIEAIEIFNSKVDGFNSTTGGTKSKGGLSGLESSNIKYSKEQLLMCLDLLIDEKLIKYKDISLKTGISEDSIRDIASSRTHTWLKSAYPEKYLKLEQMKAIRLSNRASISSKTGNVFQVKSPENNYLSVSNISQFAKEHGLERNRLTKLLKGSIKQYKGWTL